MKKILSTTLFLSILGAAVTIDAYNQHQYFNDTPFKVYMDGDYQTAFCKSVKVDLPPRDWNNSSDTKYYYKTDKDACAMNFVRGSVWAKNRKPAWTPPNYVEPKDVEVKIDVRLNGPWHPGSHTFRFKGPYNGDKLLYYKGEWATDAPYDTADKKFTYKIVKQSEE